eukprot:g3618.t1
MIRKRRHHADDFLYITKSDFKIYKQELSKMTLNSGWIETGKGDIIALVAYQDGLFGIGTNKKILGLARAIKGILESSDFLAMQ